MAKATGELDRVVGGGRLVTEEDIPRLPYLDAVVKEALRVHPVAPLLAPRLSREDTSVGGYDIPAGTRVFVNVWAIARDPALWGDASEEFRPERFVGSGVDVMHACLPAAICICSGSMMSTTRLYVFVLLKICKSRWL